MKFIVAAVAALGLAVAPALAAEEAANKTAEAVVKTGGTAPSELGQAMFAGIPGTWVLIGGTLVFVAAVGYAISEDDSSTQTTTGTN